MGVVVVSVEHKHCCARSTSRTVVRTSLLLGCYNLPQSFRVSKLTVKYGQLPAGTASVN